jgi:hypothetical protein
MPMLSYKAGRAIRRSEDGNWVDPSPEKGTLEFELLDDLAQLGTSDILFSLLFYGCADPPQSGQVVNQEVQRNESTSVAG